MILYSEIELISYLSWQMLLISKLSAMMGMINSRPGSESKVTFILQSFFLFNFLNNKTRCCQGVLLSKTELIYQLTDLFIGLYSS